MSRIVLATERETQIEVEIGDRVFDLTRMTRSKQMALDEAEKGLEAAQTTDEVVAMIGGILSVMLVPQNGQKKSAGDVVKDLWMADKVELDDLTRLLDGIREASEARPT